MTEKGPEMNTGPAGPNLNTEPEEIKLHCGIIVGRKSGTGEVVLQPLEAEKGGVEEDIKSAEVVNILIECLFYLFGDIVSSHVVAKWAAIVQQMQNEPRIVNPNTGPGFGGMM